MSTDQLVKVRFGSIGMARALLPEDLLSLIAAHLPAHRRLPKGGRSRIDDRAALTGILFVLKTGIEWNTRRANSAAGIICWWMSVGVH